MLMIFPFDRAFVSSKVWKAKLFFPCDHSSHCTMPPGFTYFATPNKTFLPVGFYVATVSTDAVSVTCVIRKSNLASVV